MIYHEMCALALVYNFWILQVTAAVGEWTVPKNVTIWLQET